MVEHKRAEQGTLSKERMKKGKIHRKRDDPKRKKGRERNYQWMRKLKTKFYGYEVATGHTKKRLIRRKRRQFGRSLKAVKEKKNIMGKGKIKKKGKFPIK